MAAFPHLLGADSHPSITSVSHKLTKNPGEEIVHFHIVLTSVAAGCLFWKRKEENPQWGSASFPTQPLGADTPPAALLPPNSPWLIHVSS